MFVDLKLKCVGPVRIKEAQAMGYISPLMAIRNMQNAIDFYKDILGFKVGLVVPTEEGIEYADVSKDGMVLMFVPTKNVGLSGTETLGIGVNMYLEIEGNLDEYYTRLNGKGVTIVADIKDEPFGIRDFTIADIDGYQLTFNQRIQSN